MSKKIQASEAHNYIGHTVTIPDFDTSVLRSVEKDKQFKAISGAVSKQTYTLTFDSRWTSIDHDHPLVVED